MTPPVLALVVSYNYGLVAVSALISILASYAALDIAGRVTATHGKIRIAWLAGGAGAMGSGSWSMHYLGMLAFKLPVVVRYDWPTVAISFLCAVFASGVALFVVSRQRMGSLESILGSLVMGRRNLSSSAFNFVNQEAESLLGYSLEQWIANSTFWINHIHPDESGSGGILLQKRGKGKSAATIRAPYDHRQGVVSRQHVGNTVKFTPHGEVKHTEVRRHRPRANYLLPSRTVNGRKNLGGQQRRRRKPVSIHCTIRPPTTPLQGGLSTMTRRGAH